MKGDNVIEGYCEVCGGPITKRHILLNYVNKKETGVFVHISHLNTNNLFLVNNPALLDMLTEHFDYIIDTRGKSGLTPEAAKDKAEELILRFGIDFKEFEKALTVYMCRIETRNPWDGLEWLKKIRDKKTDFEPIFLTLQKLYEEKKDPFAMLDLCIGKDLSFHDFLWWCKDKLDPVLLDNLVALLIKPGESKAETVTQKEQESEAKP